MARMTVAADFRAILEDPTFRMPTVPTDAPPATLAWVRAHIGRWSDGALHERRRAVAERLLRSLDPSALSDRAAARARTLRRSASEEQVIDAVPPLILAEALGMLGSGVDGMALVRATLRLSACYQPHKPQAPDADQDVALLLDAAGGRADEETATRVSFLLQACPAVANLVRGALSGERSVERTLRDDPPVRATWRVDRDGERIEVDLAGRVQEDEAPLAFGAGPHACPGSAQAVAIAGGILTALR